MQRSESIGAIAAALAKAQAAIQPAIKDANNPHFNSKYADLASVWTACRSALTANGIAVVQSPEATDCVVTVTTLLLHSSGEWISGALTAKARDAGPQSIGSATTYCRRFGLSSMVGVAPDDDDAEAATGRDAKPKKDTRREPAPQSAVTPTAPAKPGDDLISDAQRKRLFTIATGAGWTKDDVKRLLETKGYTSSKDIRVRDYDALVRVIETGEMVEDEVPA